MVDLRADINAIDRIQLISPIENAIKGHYQKGHYKERTAELTVDLLGTKSVIQFLMKSPHFRMPTLDKDAMEYVNSLIEQSNPEAQSDTEEHHGLPPESAACSSDQLPHPSSSDPLSDSVKALYQTQLVQAICHSECRLDTPAKAAAKKQLAALLSSKQPSL